MHFRFNIDTKRTKNKNYNGNQTSTEEIQQMQRKPLRCKNTKIKRGHSNAPKCVGPNIRLCTEKHVRRKKKEVIKSRAVTYETCPLSISTHPCFSPACPHPSTARASSRPPAAGGWRVTSALPSFQFVSREKDPHTASHHIQLNWTLPNPSEVPLQTAHCYFTTRRRWDKKSQVQQRNIDLFIPPSHSRIFTTTPAL